MKKILFLWRELICIDRSHHSSETDLTAKQRLALVLIQRQPDENRFAHNMILRYKSPVTTIC